MKAILTNEMATMGGTQKQIVNFARFIQEREKLKVISKTDIIDYGYTFDFLERENILQIPRIKNKILSRILAAIYLIRKLKNDKVVSLHDTGLEIEAIILALMGKKIFWQINDLHGSFRIGAHKNKSYSFKDYINKKLSKILAKLVCEIHVNVSKNAILVQEHLGTQARVFYPGVDLPDTKKTKIIHSNVILSIGVLFPYRNYEKLILAVSKINKENNLSYRVVIVGKNEHNLGYKKELEDLAKHNLVNIEFKGQISNDEMNKTWSEAEIFTFLNVDQSWGLSIFESLATNTPTLMSESVGAVELLKDYHPVQKCNAENIDSIASSILELREKYTTKPELFLAQRTFIRDMSWDKMYSDQALRRLNQ